MSGRFEKGRKPRKTALIIACVIAALVLGGVAFAATYMNNMFDEVQHVEVSKIETTAPAATEAAVQVEAAAEQTTAAAAEEAEEKSSPEDFSNYLVVCRPVWKDNQGRKTETMILVTLNEKTRTLTMTSLLENAYVQTPEYKNHAGTQTTLDMVYGLGETYGNGKAGSMELMNQTLYNNFGIEIDQNFEIDFELFAKVVRRLDYVKIDLSEEEAKYLSQETKRDIQAGEQKMDGTLASAYVAMWSDEEAAHISSIGAQRKLTEAIVNKVRTEYIADLENIVKDMLPMITTSMTKEEMRQFVLSLLPMLRDLSIEKGGTCPADYASETIEVNGAEQTVLTFDAAETTKTMRGLTKGE